MTKSNFIALADLIRRNNMEAKQGIPGAVKFCEAHIRELATFCLSQNGRFMERRWIDYINGKCGQGGGKLK